jgi:hypothetical protein
MENCAMNKWTSAAAGAALLFALGPAAAQVVEFTPEQETTIYTTVTRERVRTAPPADFRVGIGVEVPSAVELYEVPAAVEVAPARRYRYTVFNDQVVLVDPATRKVVRVIRKR